MIAITSKSMVDREVGREERKRCQEHYIYVQHQLEI